MKRFPKMNPPSFVANRTRARKAETNTTESASENINSTDAVLLGRRDRKRLAGGAVRVSDCSPQRELGFNRRKDRPDLVAIDEENEEEEEEVHVVAEGPVAKRTRSKLERDKNLTPNAGSSAPIDAVEFVPSSGQESVAGGSKSDGPGCSNEEKDRTSSGVDGCREGKFRVRSWKFGFRGTKMGASGKTTYDSDEIIDLRKEGSFNSTTAGSCVARRTRSRKGLGSEDKMAGNPVLVDLDEKQLSYNDDPTISTNGASVCEEESCSYVSGEKGEIIGTQLKRKKYSGLSLLVPVGNDNCNSDGVEGMPTSVAKRTRSHCPSQLKRKIGTMRNPYKIDVDSDPSSDGTDVDDNDGNTKGRVHLETSSSSEADDNDDEDVGDADDDDDRSDLGDVAAVDDSVHVKEALNGDVKRNEQEELRLGKSGKSRERKHNSACALERDLLFKTLMDNILEEGQDSIQKSTAQNVAPSKDETPHPLIFSFEDAPSEQKESSNMMKGLWDEFYLAMSTNNIGSFPSPVASNEDTKTREFQLDPSTLCGQGKHEFILDEQIGVVCKFCPSVKLGIKHILPSLGKNIWGKSGKKTYGDEEHISFLGGLPFRDVTGDPKSSDHCFEGTVWDIVPGIKKTMYPHQQEGFEFMWKNLAGSISLEDLKKPAKPSDIGGCVISHAPGTGKSRLTIVFLQTFMEVFPNCRPLILAPRSMILTWEKEFKKWEVDIPLHILNRKEFSGKEDSEALQLARKYKLQSPNCARAIKIYSWDKGKSILVMSYSLFERLVEKICMDEKEARVRKTLIEKPGLLILDEGHTPRNENSLIWQALEKMKTERRIILSGTPFQNNFGELYNTLCLVRPKFADKLSSAEICQRKSRMISDGLRKVLPKRREARGRWASLTNSIGKSTDDHLDVLRSIIDPFVHVHKGSILNSLPGLRDCLVYLHPPPLQQTLLDSIQEIEFSTQFKREYVSMISIHPSLLMECCLSEEEKPVVDEQLLEGARLDPNEGVKTKFVMELVRLSDAMNEKVLVFSQYIPPLSIIKDHLKFCFSWTEGKEILQMDGNVSIKQRQSSIDSFNDSSSDVKVLLASTKACCEGINLIGASRVVLLDVVWNPSVERQAISRAYRLGQQKMVYTYHLITSGTTEGDKYYRQVEKDRLSELIFSSGDVECDNKQSSLKISEDRILEEMIGHDKMKNIFEKILYQSKK